MAAEELNKPAAAPKPAAKQEPASNAGNGDMANLIGNVGVLIDSTIESVQGVLSSVTSATGQLLDGVNSTINSEPVKEMISNVNSVSGQLIDGVTATLKSEQVQSSMQEIGKLWSGVIENINTTVNSTQVQDMFANVSTGLGQMLNNIIPAAAPAHEDAQRKEVKQIPFSHQEQPAPKPAEPVKAAAPSPAAAPKAPAPAPTPAAAPRPQAPTQNKQQKGGYRK